MALHITRVEPHPTLDGKIRVSFNQNLKGGSVIDAIPSLATGLLAFYQLDGNSNDELATNNGADTAISYVTGYIRQAASFNGTTSLINLGSGIPLDSNNWSIAAWIRQGSSGAFYIRVISYYGNGPTIQTQGGAVWLCHGGTSDFNCNITLTNDVWTHVVITRAGSTVTAYKNGAQTAQNTGFGASYTADTSVRLGNSTAFNEPYTGVLDDVGFWSRALTSIEVGQLYASVGADPEVSDPTNYTITGGSVTVDSVAGVGADVVDLTCTGLAKGTVYLLSLSSDIHDESDVPIASPGNDFRFGYFYTNNKSRPLFHAAGKLVLQSITYPGFMKVSGQEENLHSMTLDGISHPSQNTLVLTFSDNIVLQGAALNPANWKITGTGLAVTCTGVSAPDNQPTVTLTITEQTQGGSYTITVPSEGISGQGIVNFAGPFTQNFTGIGSPPSVLQARSANDARKLDVIFNEPVVESEALTVGNYSINNGLTASKVEKIDSITYRLTTSKQTVGASYLVTVSNIHDLNGNLI